MENKVLEFGLEFDELGCDWYFAGKFVVTITPLEEEEGGLTPSVARQVVQDMVAEINRRLDRPRVTLHVPDEAAPTPTPVDPLDEARRLCR